MSSIKEDIGDIVNYFAYLLMIFKIFNNVANCYLFLGFIHNDFEDDNSIEVFHCISG